MKQLIITIVFDVETKETNFSITQMKGAEAHLGNITYALGSVQQQAAAGALAQIKSAEKEVN